MKEKEKVWTFMGKETVLRFGARGKLMSDLCMRKQKHWRVPCDQMSLKASDDCQNEGEIILNN